MSGFSREDIKFDSSDSFCAGWLYRPTGVDNPPVIVLCHGLGAVREMRLDTYAERFAAEGYAVLAFTYRHFGDSGGEPRQLLNIGKELDDIAAALKLCALARRGGYQARRSLGQFVRRRKCDGGRRARRWIDLHRCSVSVYRWHGIGA